MFAFKYDPEQERDPEGSATGGQWTKDGGTGEKSKTPHDDDPVSVMSDKSHAAAAEAEFNSLTAEANDEIDLLTTMQREAITAYSGGAFYQVNNLLRTTVENEKGERKDAEGFDSPEFEDYRQTVEELKGAILSMPPLEHDISVWRGVPNSKGRFTHLKAGDVIEEKAFMSTSNSPQFVTQFLQRSEHGKAQSAEPPVLFKTILPKGERVMPMTEKITRYANEKEILLRPGLRTRVVSVKDVQTRNGPKVRMVTLEVA